jgi:hypothetical protein
MPAPRCATKPTDARHPGDLYCAMDTGRHFGARGAFRKQSHGRSYKIWAMKHRAALLVTGLAVVLANTFVLDDKPRQLCARLPAMRLCPGPSNTR